MSWGVNVNGTIVDVRSQLSELFKAPLAEKPAGLLDDGERKTVLLVQEMIDQCLSTFGSERTVAVSAYGHMGFGDWAAKEGAYQEVTISIKPGS